MTATQTDKDRLFIASYPTGIIYADRGKDNPRTRDYQRCGYLPYRSLVLEIEPGCPPFLRDLITTHAATLQAMRGQSYVVSGAGQTVLLGSGV